MRNPDDPKDADFRADLPPELQKLDEELSAIRIEERPSFGPELERELAREWQKASTAGVVKPRRWARTLVAAGLACLMVAGVAVPSARGMVAQLIRAVVEEAFPSREAPPPGPELETVGAQAQDPGLTPGDPLEDRAIRASEVDDEPDPLTGPESTFSPVVITFPEILRRDEAERLISLRYPLALQRAGVGGSVRLMFWVNHDGTPENINLREGSGYVSLNRAAMLAARELRFRPATRNGQAVGTWVEFEIHFVPGEGAGIGDPGPAGGEGIGGS
jgi:TonB family protein